MISVKTRWQNIANRTLPLGYALRDQYKDNWLRIHSLPAGKRYPDTKSEKAELLKRYSDVFNDCFVGNDTYLIVGFYQDSLKEKEAISWIKEIDFMEFDRVDVSDDDEPYLLFLFGGLFKRNEAVFREMVMDVANERIKPLLFFSDVSKTVYAPYDGGIDIFFLDDKEKLLRFKNKYINWLSQRKDGL